MHGVRRNFSRGVQRRHFAFHFQVANVCSQNALPKGVVLKKEVWELRSHAFPPHYTHDLG